MSERDSLKQSEKRPANKQATQAEWTLAVDLAAGEPSRLDLSQQEKLKSLHELSTSTKDKPVTVLIQEIKPNPRYGEDGRAFQPYILNHSSIRDGQIHRLGFSYSQGLAADSSSFLDMSLKDYPSKKTGLFLHCHGRGNRGLTGDAGKSSIREYAQSIKRTLANNKIPKLDIIDLDCCLMAQDGVLSAVQTISKDLVASSEIELAIKGHPAQNTKKIVESVLQRPLMNGSQLAETIVDQAKDGANDDNKLWRLTTTPTLAHFDLENGHSRFNNALNAFGSELKRAVINPRNKTQLEVLIENTPRLSALMMIGDEEKQHVDVKCFAQEIQQALKLHVLSDPDRRLQKATDKLLGSMDKLTVSFRGAKQGAIPGSWMKYDQLGGLNIFLPDKQMRSRTSKELAQIYQSQLQDSNLGWREFVHSLGKP